ncbi:MAG: ABC transporter permease [Nitrospinae bacterium]|nr:ABC transporter permease [Nitrospinota bacterium]
MDRLLLASVSLWRREMVRFYRDKPRVIGGLVPPVIFWIFIGSGLKGSFHMGGLDYSQYFYPGTLVLIFLFTAVFSTMTVIEDRKEGFLQSVLVSPAPRSAVVIGKLFGGASLAFMQGLPFLAAAPLVGIELHPDTLMLSLLVLFGVAFSLSGIGFVLAWVIDSTQGFHAVMNMGLVPLWLVSGALFPLSNLPGWLDVIVKINPLTYCVAALQWEFFPQNTGAGLPPFWICAVVIALFCAVTFALAVWVTGRGRDQHV